MRFNKTMTTTTFTSQGITKDAEAEFWAECRRRAIELNVPAWLIAEQWYAHGLLDNRSDA
jgi:hypothetical protein